MGTGTDIVMESAGVTLAKGDLNALVRAIQLSRATMKNIRLNLIFALAYNALGIPVAAGNRFGSTYLPAHFIRSPWTSNVPRLRFG
jgi:cation transport ATPase